MKTAEEILKKHCKGKVISERIWSDWDVMRAMEEYANQFKSAPSEPSTIPVVDTVADVWNLHDLMSEAWNKPDSLQACVKIAVEYADHKNNKPNAVVDYEKEAIELYPETNTPYFLPSFIKERAAHIRARQMSSPSDTLFAKLKKEIVESLLRHEHISDEKYLVRGRTSFTRRGLATEIENETVVGLEIIENSILLSLDLLSKGKTPSDTNCKVKELIEYVDTLQSGLGNFETIRLIKEKANSLIQQK